MLYSHLGGSLTNRGIPLMKNKIHRKRDAIKPVFCRSHHYKLPLELNGKKHIFLGSLMRIRENTNTHQKNTKIRNRTGVTRPKTCVCVCVCYCRSGYLAGLGSTLRVGNDLHRDDPVGFFLYVKTTPFFFTHIQLYKTVIIKSLVDFSAKV